jgi:D-lactate dehydrogenase (cytochrome)
MVAEKLYENLATLLGEGTISRTSGDIQEHGQDESAHTGHLPDVVVWPRNRQDVQAVVGWANEHHVPVTAWGAGTSVEGNPIPVQGGIVLDFREMNEILAIHETDFQVTVQPGVLYKDMNRKLGKLGLFFAPDPGANASIGGMIANNAAGVRTVKYGATKDNVLALEVVLANGEVVHTGSRSPKQSSGYDLTHLFAGSEGTLGIITEATLQLAPLPEHYSAAVAAFPEVAQAADAIYRIMACGLEPSAMEILDTYCVHLLNREEHLGLEETPTIIMEFCDASVSGLEERLTMVEEICRDVGCMTFDSGVGRDERARLWEARHRLFEILVRSHPGQTWILSDMGVPISAFPEMVHRARELSEAAGVKGVINGHAGDGNIHATYFFPPEDLETRAKVERVVGDLTETALTLGGTSTGEHGVGLGKQKFMVREHGTEGVALMKSLKATLDPNNILNPGKIF